MRFEPGMANGENAHHYHTAYKSISVTVSSQELGSRSWCYSQEKMLVPDQNRKTL